MAKPERRDPAKERFWRGILERWLRSGWTARDFCLEHDLSEANFYAWRREIARRDQEVASAAPTQPLITTRSAESPKSHEPAPPVFLQVALPDADDTAATPLAPPTPPALEVLLGRRRRLRVRAGFDADLFRQLVRLLEEPSC